MTITKTMKTKLVLGILAAAVSLSLAIGGTLMLFSAGSETATNIVTIGEGLNDFALQEKGGVDPTSDDYVDDYTTVDGEFTGINFGKVLPGAILDKYPRVIRTDETGADAYLRIAYQVKAEKGGVDVLLPGDTFNADVAGVVDAIVRTAETNPGWVLVPDFDDDDNWLYTGYYYYGTEADGAIDLDTFETNSKTVDIFDGFEIPAEWGAEELGAIEGYKLSVVLTAQAIQVDNNEQGDKDASAVFAQFDEPAE